MFYAYCWATGLIEFGESVPGGAIEIARGDRDAVRRLMIATARHGKQQHTDAVSEAVLLVPGVPEAADQAAAGDALATHLNWLAEREKRGGLFRINRMRRTA